MSRSRDKSKSPGEEYWSKRPGTKQDNDPGPEAKRLNNRLERIEGKKQAKKNNRYCPDCECLEDDCQCELTYGD